MHLYMKVQITVQPFGSTLRGATIFKTGYTDNLDQGKEAIVSVKGGAILAPPFSQYIKL